MLRVITLGWCGRFIGLKIYLFVMRITLTGLKILELFHVSQRVKNVCEKLDLDSKIIWDSYLKKYIKYEYIKKVNCGCYKLSKKGCSVLRYYKNLPKIEKEIISLAKLKTKNKEIIQILANKFDLQFSHSAVYSKISRLRKTEKINWRNKNKVNIPKKFSKELAEFVGLVFTDGYISNYDVCFYNKDAHLLNRFEKLAKDLFEITHFKRREKHKGVFENRFTSIEIVAFLQSLIKYKTTLPFKILNGGNIIKYSFLKGYFSGDGSAAMGISYKTKKQKFEILPFLAIACIRQNILKQLYYILVSLGFKKILLDKSGIRLNYQKDVKRFHKHIGFVDGCQTYHSKYWVGFTKNKILAFAATKLPDPELNKLLCHHNKEAIISYIRTKLSE